MKRKDILGLKDLNEEEIVALTSRAERRLDGLNIFIDSNSDASELIADRLRTLGAHVTVHNCIDETYFGLDYDVIMISSQYCGVARILASRLNSHVIALSDGRNEQPIEALAVLSQLRDCVESFEGLKVGIIGSATSLPVGKSLMYACKKLNTDVTVVAPRFVVHTDIEKLNIPLTSEIERISHNADIIIDLGYSGEVSNKLSYNEYYSAYRIDKQRFRSNEDCIVCSLGKLSVISSEVINTHKIIRRDISATVAAAVCAIVKITEGCE